MLKLAFIVSASAFLGINLETTEARIAAIAAILASAIYIGQRVVRVLSILYGAAKRTFDGVAVLEELPGWMKGVDTTMADVNRQLENGAIHMSRLDHRLDALHGHTAVGDGPGEQSDGGRRGGDPLADSPA